MKPWQLLVWNVINPIVLVFTEAPGWKQLVFMSWIVWRIQLEYGCGRSLINQGHVCYQGFIIGCIIICPRVLCILKEHLLSYVVFIVIREILCAVMIHWIKIRKFVSTSPNLNDFVETINDDSHYKYHDWNHPEVHIPALNMLIFPNYVGRLLSLHDFNVFSK